MKVLGHSLVLILGYEHCNCCEKLTGLLQASAFFLLGALAVRVSLGITLNMQRNRKNLRGSRLSP